MKSDIRLYYLLSLFSLLIAFSSCKKSTDYQIPNEAVFAHNGLIPSDIIIYIQKDTVTRNKFNYAEKVNVEFVDIVGFVRENGLVYPGMSTTIIQGRDTLIHNSDIFSNLDNGTDLKQLDLVSYFRAIFPYKNDGNFELHIYTWDKKGDASFSFRMPFIISHNQLISFDEGGLTCKSAYFFDEFAEESKNSNVFNQKGQLILHFEELSGFHNIDGKIFPAMSIMISDSMGYTLIDEVNIFSNFSEIGISPSEIDSLFPVQLILTEGLASPYAHMKVRIYDLNSANFLELETDIEIRPAEEPKKGIHSLQHAV